MKTGLSNFPCVSTKPEDILVYGYDSSMLEKQPIAVARPTDVGELVELVRAAYAKNIALIPRGAGTGTVGGSVPVEQSSVVISFERMNRILEIDKENMVAVVEPGVINGVFQRTLKDQGLFYPPDPASLNFSTLGGNVATGAGGPRAVKYGVTRDYVLGLEIVLPDGTVTNTGVRTAKGVVGYDLTRLIVGSEGTLAFVTKITLKILPEPETVVTLVTTFDSISNSAQTVSKIMASGIVPRTLEFMDKNSLKVVESYKHSGLPTSGAMLLIELDGPTFVVNREIENISAICKSFAGEVQIARSEAAAEKLWEARRSISPALYRISTTKINQDIVVPRSSVPEMLLRLDEIAEKTGLFIVNFGHAGDGNIHVNIMTDKSDPEKYNHATAAVDDIFRATLELNGTISGEHGVGLKKKPYIEMELDEVVISLMKHIKRVFDPAGIMNPGKIFP